MPPPGTYPSSLTIILNPSLSPFLPQVDIYTAYYDPTRCFEETLSGAFSVRTAGSWFPRSIFGRAMALCAYIRCILVALKLAWDSRKNPYDVIFVDQVSAVNPFLKILTPAKVLFYCHFPDLLLAQRRSALHSFYRMPLDWFEQMTTGWADVVLVNSGYTQNIFQKTFTRLHTRGVVPSILYPAVHPPTDTELETASETWRKSLPENVVELITKGPTFLSINRFERKKGIGLAIEALNQLSKGKKAPSGLEPRLVIAGGYDARLSENVEHLQELDRLATGLGVRDRVAFVPSFTDAQRAALLAACLAVLYTPQGEHFGIVPLEAMAAGRPVVACNSGGPLESVVSRKTGFLCEPAAEAWSGAMAELMKEGVAQKMGVEAQNHVREKFSRAAFGEKLNEVVVELARQKSKAN